MPNYSQTPLLTKQFRLKFANLLRCSTYMESAIAMSKISHHMKKWGNDEIRLIEKLWAIEEDLSFNAPDERQGETDSTRLPQSIVTALDFALDAHNFQQRKSNSDITIPYFCHLLDVVGLLIRCKITDELVLVAAALHDTIEDTKITSDIILQSFGEDVCKLVMQLSEGDYPPGQPKPSKRERNQSYIDGLRHCPHDIQRQTLLISTADKLSNGHDYLSYPLPDEEKELQLWFYGELMPMYLDTTHEYPILQSQLKETWQQLQQVWSQEIEK